MVRMASWVGWPCDPWEGHKVRGASGGAAHGTLGGEISGLSGRAVQW